MPTSKTCPSFRPVAPSFIEFRENDWQKIYAEDFTSEQKTKIIDSLNKAVDQSGMKAEKPWGETIEDRGSQITYSALGQQAPLDPKEKWDPDFAKRKKIKATTRPDAF